MTRVRFSPDGTVAGASRVPPVVSVVSTPETQKSASTPRVRTASTRSTGFANLVSDRQELRRHYTAMSTPAMYAGACVGDSPVTFRRRHGQRPCAHPPLQLRP